MFFIKLLRFFLGYLKIRISGRFPERFLNVCAQKNITIWNTCRRGDSIEGYIFSRDYKKIRKYRRACGARLKIRRRYGLPFFLHKYRARSGMLAGAAVCFAILLVMPMFIWDVDVQGNVSVSSEKIAAELEKLGVAQGTLRSSIDTDNLRQKLLLNMPELSWAAINLKGTKATVDVRERMTTPEKQENTAPCNLKAARDGRIVAIRPTQGNAVVQVGDAVVAGDLLVSGTIEHKTGDTSFVHSDGEIIASTERSLSFTAAFKQTETVRTGKVSTRRVLHFFGLDLPLYLGSVQFPYEKESNEEILQFDGQRLPIGVTTARFYETEKRTRTLSKDEALKLATKEIERLEEAELQGAKIVSREPVMETYDYGVKLTVHYVCEENIAKKDFIMINASK